MEVPIQPLPTRPKFPRTHPRFRTLRADAKQEDILAASTSESVDTNFTPLPRVDMKIKKSDYYQPKHPTDSKTPPPKQFFMSRHLANRPEKELVGSIKNVRVKVDSNWYASGFVNITF
ncbi:Hypothetical protein EIN_054170, partial [Entamoeba invadens IP1]|uniref:Hypothetical protein n=1 Tax=Entamoeba invadens IP1 TaxID=370355 RepID=UPI0002C3E41A